MAKKKQTLADYIAQRQREIAAEVDPFYNNPQARINFLSKMIDMEKQTEEDRLKAMVKANLATQLAKQEQKRQAILDELKTKMPFGSILDNLTGEVGQKIGINSKAITDEMSKLRAIGINPDNLLDDRTWLGKILNVPKDLWQTTGDVVGKTLDVLNRPVKALEGGLIEGAKRDAAEINIDPVAWQAWKGATNDAFKSQAEIDAWKKKNKARYESFLQKVEQFRNQNGDTQDAILGGAKKALTGQKTYSLAQGIAEATHKKAPSIGDVASELAFDLTADPLNVLGEGAFLAAKSVGKGISSLAKSTGILDKKPVRSAIDLFDNLFQSGSKNRTLTGEVDATDFVKEAERKWITTQKNLGYESERNIAKAMLLAGEENATDVGKVMELDNLKVRLDPLEEEYQKTIEAINRWHIEGNMGTPPKDLIEKYNSLKNNAERIRLGRKIQAIEAIKNTPEIAKAAEDLVKGNQPILDLAKSLGYNLDVIKGYMAHVWTDGMQELLKNKPMLKKYFEQTGVKVSDRALKRMLNMTVDEINATLGKKLGVDVFSPNAFFATKLGRDRIVKFLSFEGLKRDLFSNPNFAIHVDDAKNLELAEMNLAKKNGRPIAINLKDYTPINDPMMKEWGGLLGLKEGEYYITPGAYKALERFKNTLLNDEELHKFLKVYDKLTSWFKRSATFSLSHHFYNLTGMTWNQYVYGMSLADVARYNAKAFTIINKAEKAAVKLNPLSEAEKQAVKIYKEFREAGLSGSGYHSDDMVLKQEQDVINSLIEAQKSPAQRIIGRALKGQVFEASRRAAEYIDETARLGMYMWARANGKSAGEATRMVRETLYDYNDLTDFERKIMRRIAPFYTYTRKNMPFVLKSLLSAPARINRANNVVNAAYEATGQNQNLVPDYLRAGLALPISKDRLLSLNLPISDLTKLNPDNWLKTVGEMANPVLKLPFELASNKNFFTGQDITQFEGQKTFLGLDPKLQHTIEEMFPFVKRITQGLEKGQKEGVIRGILKMAGLDVAKDYDPAKFTSQILGRDRKRLEDAIKQLEVSGVKVPGIDDLRKAGLAANVQVNEKQVQDFQNLRKKAIEQGIDPDIVAKFKQQAMQSTEDKIPAIIKAMQSLGIPDDLIMEATKDHLNKSAQMSKITPQQVEEGVKKKKEQKESIDAQIRKLIRKNQ